MIVFRKDELPEIINYKPTEFTYYTSQPLYYKMDNDLYYSDNGQFNKKIKLLSNLDKSYQNSTKFVSPDSKYILVFRDNSIVIISHAGHIIDVISPVKSYDIEGHKTGHFWRDNIQWTRDSKSFLIPKDESNGETYLYRYSLDNKKISRFLSKDIKDKYYISNNNNNIYSQYFNPNSNKYDWIKTNCATESSTVIDSNLLNIEGDSVFVNFKEPFGSSYAMTSLCDTLIKVFTRRSTEESIGGLYISKNGKITDILKVKDGYTTEKSKFYNLNLSGYSCFLPGGRYFFLNDETKQNKGSIIIDIENLQYMEINKIENIYFSITNKDCNMDFY